MEILKEIEDNQNLSIAGMIFVAAKKRKEELEKKLEQVGRSEIKNGLQFVCPNCGDKRLESIETNTIASSTIINIAENGDFDYNAPVLDSSDVDHFQCFNCGYVLIDSRDNLLTQNLEAAEWVKKNCKQDN